MTLAQIKYYRSQWSKVAKFLTEYDYDKEEVEEYRLEMHQELGLPASSKDFKNNDLDQFIRACRKILGESSIDVVDQKRKRIVWLIDQLGFNDKYLNEICTDKKVGFDWRAMRPEELLKLLMTAKTRRKSLDSKK